MEECRKGSQHISIRYFLITDKIDKKEIRVRYSSTKEILTDFYTKPIQCRLFQKFRNLILGVDMTQEKQCKKEYEETISQYGSTLIKEDVIS